MITLNEGQILQRLIDRVDAKVYSSAELATIEEKQQKTPALHLIYDGYTPIQEQANGLRQELEHRWLVVVAVRNARGLDEGKDIRKEASALIDAVIENLIGWKPDESKNRAMKIAAAPAPAYSSSFGYFPLAFTTRTQHRGKP